MDGGRMGHHLVWVTRTLAVNPASIQSVFHGLHGEIEVLFVGGKQRFTEGDLSEDGRALLLPPVSLASSTAGSDR